MIDGFLPTNGQSVHLVLEEHCLIPNYTRMNALLALNRAQKAIVDDGTPCMPAFGIGFDGRRLMGTQTISCSFDLYTGISMNVIMMSL